MKKFFILILLSIALLQNLFTENSFQNAISSYKQSYFLFYGSPAKFQISIKYRIILPKNPTNDTGIYFAYTQKSLWDIWDTKNSSPFIETNYAPEIFFDYYFRNKSELFNNIKIGVEHESNGIGGLEINKSRSWNNFYISTNLNIIKNNFKITPKICLPFGLKENPNIVEYLGIGEIILDISKFNLFYETALYIKIRKGINLDNKGNIEIGHNIGYFEIKSLGITIPLAFYFQFFYGYGETLLNYDQFSSKLRLGLNFILP